MGALESPLNVVVKLTLDSCPSAKPETSNVIFAEPTAAAFAEGILRALRQPVPAADLSPFDIGTLANELTGILERLIARRGRALVRGARGEVTA